MPPCWSASRPAVTQRGEPAASQPTAPGSLQSSPNSCARPILTKLAKMAPMDIHMHVTMNESCSSVIFPKNSERKCYIELSAEKLGSLSLWGISYFSHLFLVHSWVEAALVTNGIPSHRWVVNCNPSIDSMSMHYWRIDKEYRYHPLKKVPRSRGTSGFRSLFIARNDIVWEPRQSDLICELWKISTVQAFHHHRHD